MSIYGVIGWPVKHSLSPAMHNAAFKELGIEAEYKLFEVRPEELEYFILNRKDVAGFNITVPHKIKAREILEKKHEAPVKHTQFNVMLTGAVNTVKRTVNTLEYQNTDVLGFQTALKEDLKFDADNKNALVIGCGGAGRAVIAALSNIGINKMYVCEINKAQVDSAKEYFSKLSQDWQAILKKKIEYISSEQLPEKINECQLLVNASPVGMKEGGLGVVDKKILHKDLYVYDVVYNRETELIRDAKLLGLRCAGGLSMLLYQGAHAFEFWTGKIAPIKVMKKALKQALS
nr:shikimate dehydrogenase [Candidatus Omnitrophota bacterium]